MKLLKAPIPKALVEELDNRFPEKCPSTSDTDRDIWVYTGRRQLIKLLKEHLELQDENFRGGTNVHE